MFLVINKTIRLSPRSKGNLKQKSWITLNKKLKRRFKENLSIVCNITKEKT
jgi:hypothetical protein